MSEFTKSNDKRLRWSLLATASAMTLLSFGYRAEALADDDTDRPLVWIELGGQLSRLQDGQETFLPPLMDGRPSMFSPSQKFERPPLYSVDETGKLSFRPEDSDWIFSASVRYGRSTSQKHIHQQSYPKSFVTHATFSGYRHTYSFAPIANKFADTRVTNNETHAIVDFQAGKDVGLGMFGGGNSSSTINLGVRFAQFSSRSNIALKSDPDWKFAYKYFTYTPAHVTHVKWVSHQPYHSNAANLYATRKFHGVGPSISWSASALVAGSLKAGEINFDWGFNAAVLFGRQKTQTHHQSTRRYGLGSNYDSAKRPITAQGPATPNHTRSHTVTVPNVGGFAGLSFQIQNFKVSAGYRADLFFNALDGGIDARKSENVGFYGPFTTISVGLGG